MGIENDLSFRERKLYNNFIFHVTVHEKKG